MTKLLSLSRSRRSLILLVTLLVLVLAACERPLNPEEEATVTPEPTEVTAPESSTEETAPTLVPTQGAEPSEPSTETGEQPAQPSGEATAVPTEGEAQEGGQTEPSAPSEEGTTTEPAQPTSPPDQPTGEQVHTVAPGENLFRIGLRYGCPYQQLAAYNGIANPHYINVGQQIRIPANCGGEAKS